MEGKGVLFKKFADVDVFDLELNANTVEEMVNSIKALEPTFGGVNLEDIKAPECFEVERRLIEKCKVPIFHDDQHGTAIVTVAGMLNALEIQGKSLATAKLVVLGAGAAAISCSRLLLSAGLPLENLLMLDRKGVIHSGRDDLNKYKQEFANPVTTARTLDDAIDGADIFLGLSGPDMLSAEQLKKMAPNPIVFACANPDPEIKPELALATRDDLIMATGRSDYPNQVNNVLGFPFVFRGALDVRATAINEAMKLAAAYAIKDLAREEVLPEVVAAYGGEQWSFGRNYIIPKALDSRLLNRVAGAVARAAVETGVARLPLPEEYKL
jgi:malate dehydrogenase (oxaloacetate-decarboxylating)(NADP+)